MFESLSALAFPNFDPVAFHIPFAGIAVRWYGLAYMVGLLLGWLYVRRLAGNARLWHGKSPMTPEHADSLLLWATLGVVLGGRLGFVLFYQPGYYLQNPDQILAMWKGGMAFHGGLLGTGLAIWLFSRRNSLPVLSVMDVVAAATPIGLFFGRIANFINGELYGRPSSLPWAMEFPNRENPAVLTEPRHPSQLYEGFFEGLVLFLVISYLIHKRDALTKPGRVTGIFLFGYGAARIFCEFFRDYDMARFFTVSPYLTSGMVYSVPMLLLGVYFFRLSRPGRVAAQS